LPAPGSESITIGREHYFASGAVEVISKLESAGSFAAKSDEL